MGRSAAGLLLLACACDPAVSPPGARGPDDTGGAIGPTDPIDGGAGTLPYTMSGFSFVDDLAAGMPRPGSRVALEVDLGFLAEQDLALLVSLTVDPIDPHQLRSFGLDAMHLPIEDFHAPTLEQQHALVDELARRAEAGEKVGVHCTAGLGRTGTMLATWFVAGGMDAATAIDTIRQLRPGSIETAEQERSVVDFELSLRTER